MGQDYPLTGPSPGANPTIYPSSLPRASGNLFSDISPKSHGFFFSVKHLHPHGEIVLTTTTGLRVWYHLCLLLLVRQAGYIVNLLDFYSYRIIGKTDRFFAASGVQLEQTQRDMFHFRRAVFSAQLKAKVGSTLAKAAALRITLNIDGSPITSRTHTHPYHSQTSRLLTSSLSLGVPVPRVTQCM
jgi:hypothetical protein